MGALSLIHQADLVRAVEVAARTLGGVAERLPAADLARVLYTDWYAAAVPTTGPVGAVTSAVADRPGLPLAAVLRAVHPDAEQWQAAVVLRSALRGTVLVRLADGIRALARGDVAPTADRHLGAILEPGDPVLVRVRTGGLVEDGWWRTWGGGCAAGHPPAAQLTRIYLAPQPESIHVLLPGVLRILRDLGSPWLVKVGAHRTMLARPDGVVVYLPDPVAGLATGTSGPVVQRLADAAAGLVRDARPALTAPVAPGISWVQDPGDGSSFGETVCRVLARPLLAAHPAPDLVAAPQRLLPLLQHALSGAGIDPRAPHLRPIAPHAA